MLDGADEIVLVDAVSSGAPPGTVHSFDASAEPLPAVLFGASSTHALGLAEAVELARSLGRLPGRVLVYGVEGGTFAYGKGLSPEVEARRRPRRRGGGRMHEKHLTEDLVRELEALAAAEGGARVTRIRVRLGALSHFTPDHFREHFEDAARGTQAEGAEIEAELAGDPGDPGAQGVVLETVELELADSGAG